MTKHSFKDFWKDSVWSKVISAIIIAFGTVVYNLVISKTEKIDFKTAFINFWTSSVQLWVVVLLFIAYLIATLLIKNFKNKKVVKYEYNDNTLKLDLELFNKIKNDLLPQDGAIYWLRHNNFAGFSFNVEKLDQLDYIEHEAKKSDFEFLNPELEKLKTELLKEIEAFTTLMATNTFPTKNGLQSIPSEWEREQPDRFRKVVNEVHENKHRLCEKYDELIRNGRRILKN